ncbi:insulinase family protein [Treponema sp.]|uniref:insulinase family protein n=1 Tax=Treponema sp. TaxID=166 RepID=UPI0025EC6917|nr:insulinase family protein [Treponema sp.]MCR5218812.1 insulinase family protein [Treponema sp.]
MKKLIRAILVILALTWVKIPAQENLKFEGNNAEVNILTLSNGLTVFVRTDSTIPLIHTELICRAGYSSQNTGNTGFFSLYSQLFTKTASSLKNNPLDFIDVEALCSADSSSYTADVPEEYLEEYLNALCLCLSSPLYSDGELKSTFAEYKKEINEYALSLSGFINTSIDSKVFAEEPWKQESGIYPSFFSGYSLGEVRTILKNIQKEYYIPDNCALFITGNISKDKVYDICQKEFFNWKNSAPVKNQIQEEKLPEEKQKKYAIISPDFSPELTQLVLQYTSLDEAECDILSAAFNAVPSPLKNELLSEESLAIRSEAYISAAAARKNGSSRLIIQSLLEKSSQNNPVSQAELFMSKVKHAAIMDRSMFIKAQDSVNGKYLNTAGSSIKAMELLADFWALDKEVTADTFCSRFSEFTHSVYTKTERDITKKILSSQPFIFLIINDSLWNDFEEDFIKAGYEKIQTDSGFWYNQELMKAKALEEKKAELTPLEETLAAITGSREFTPEDLFYFHNYSQIKSFNLLNGIKCAVKETEGSSSAVLSLAIAGGEAASPEKELQLRTILVNALSININSSLNKKKNEAVIVSNPQISAWTEENKSFIQIEFLPADLEEVLASCISSLIWAEIQPLTADHLVSEQNYQWSLKKQYLDFQLKSAFLRQAYNKTEYEKLYDLQSPILKATTYESLALNYTKLLDASLYSIVIAGDVKAGECEKLLEESFGLLKEQTACKDITSPLPDFKKKNYKFQLSHNYTSDKTIADAPKDVPVLVPTKTFTDPALIIFKGPENYGEEEIFNALLIDLSLRISKKLSSPVTQDLMTSDFNGGIITIEKIKKTSELTKALKEALGELKEELNDDNNSEKSLLRLKAQWSVKALTKCQTLKGTAELLHKSLIAGNPFKYLEDYTLIEKAITGDFLQVLENSFKEEDALKVFSADTKK